jgi:hypothetical protein
VGLSWLMSLDFRDDDYLWRLAWCAVREVAAFEMPHISRDFEGFCVEMSIGHDPDQTLKS